VSKVRPSVRKFHSSEYLNALASGEICFAVGFSGDVKQAQKRAAEAKNGVEWPRDPQGGRAIVVRQPGDPADAKKRRRRPCLHRLSAEPEVAAKNSNLVSYANGNLASQKLIDKDVLDDRTVYPDEATMSRLYTSRSTNNATQRLMNRLWTRIKTGR